MTPGLTLLENVLGPRLLAEGCARAARLEGTRRHEMARGGGYEGAMRGHVVVEGKVGMGPQDRINEIRRRRGLSKLPAA